MAYVKESTLLPLPAHHSKYYISAATKRYKYMRRMFKFHQMDFEFAHWQLIYLFIAPQKVYRNFQYRKQSKSQFARDDPAFLVLLFLWLFFISIVFSIVLELSFLKFVVFLLYIIFVDCIGAGLLIATIFWYISNKYFRQGSDQNVEWAYTFDIHLNAFFPLLTILHFCLLFSWIGSIVDGPAFFLVGNTFCLIAVYYYIYITFLGFRSLRFLQHTQSILLSLPLVAIIYIVSLITQFNMTAMLHDFYQIRV